MGKKRIESNNGLPDVSGGWLDRRSEIAVGLIETLIHPTQGFRKKKVHPERRGFAGKVIESVEDGFRALNGSRLWLLDKKNRKAASLVMEEGLVIRVLGTSVIEIHPTRAKVPVLEVGRVGRSWLELYAPDGEKRYVSITASGKLSVRKTPPEKKI